MRELKFRAWLKKEKKMVFISSLDFFYPTGLISEFMYVTDDLDERAEGIDAEIMQYTGLKDKNSKEIYEGDILGYKTLAHNRTWNCIVSFEDGSFIYREPSPWDKYSIILRGDEMSSAEVIGNIYENPELLESAVKEKE